MTKTVPTCPECGSTRTWKDGARQTEHGKVQRYCCRDCGYRFSKTNSNLSNEPRQVQISHRMPLNIPFSLLSNRQICVTKTKGAKNLVKVELEAKTALRESNKKGNIVSFAWHLKKIGRSEATIRTYTKYIEIIANHGNLNDPESTKLVIATHFTDRNTKRLATYSYCAFLKFLGVQWEKPQYKKEHKRVFIPTDQELQTAINTGTKKSLIFSHFLYETGARVNEAERLEWTDIDQERNKVTVKASKNGNSRTIPISKNLIDRLFKLPKKTKRVFPKRSAHARTIAFRYRMKNLARIHDNPRFLKIHCHTFRHCKALREYHKTKSILHVKRVLGHKSIMTTQTYVELYEEIYADLKPENFISAVASSEKERRQLIESGFEWIGQDNDGLTYFRKPNL